MSDDKDPDRLRPRMARSVVDPSLMREFHDVPDETQPRSDGARLKQASVRRGDVERFGSGGGAPRALQPTARVIIELNSDWEGGVGQAREAVIERIVRLEIGGRLDRNRGGRHYVFAELTEAEVADLAKENRPDRPSPILRMWRDEPLYPLLGKSVRTVKADACIATFGADGDGIVVAVADSGIDEAHPHFTTHRNLLDLPPGVDHADFTSGEGKGALSDGYGHGTHVAGIVAGLTGPDLTIARVGEVREMDGSVTTVVDQMKPGTVLKGVAPKAKLVSLKVLDDAGRGYSSALIEALEHVHEVNQAGRRIRIHCVNLSLGYPFEAEWFAAGHSPLCEVVNRLSRSGVVVVAAAGNDGSILLQTEGRTNRQRLGMDQSINDPGNADEAITVGATHAESPHTYGVSFFSSRGPTADGRVKPDLVAPGERILSCAAASSKKFTKALADAGETAEAGLAYFREESGTSMAAPHVAGAVAALLSVRKEFIGRPAAVKQILTTTCTDLHRKADFQGAGLLDLLRALQSV